MWSPTQRESKPLSSAARAIPWTSGQRTTRSTSGSWTPTSNAAGVYGRLAVLERVEIDVVDLPRRRPDRDELERDRVRGDQARQVRDRQRELRRRNPDGVRRHLAAVEDRQQAAEALHDHLDLEVGARRAAALREEAHLQVAGRVAGGRRRRGAAGRERERVGA